VRVPASLALVTALALTAAGSAAPVPRPLHGVPLRGQTGIRLLVASNPPYVLDVDSGRTAPVRGIPNVPHATLSVRPAGRDALVVLDRVPVRPRRKLPVEEIYVVRHGTTTAKLLGTGWGVVPSADGRAVWISAHVGVSRCQLRGVSLGGRQRFVSRPFPCGWLDQGGSLGLILHRPTRDELVDPRSLRMLLHAPRILAVAGRRVLTEDRANGLTLIDMTTSKHLTLAWPSSLGGTDDARVDSSGRLLAIGFSDPAYRGGQATDVWLLDTGAGRFRPPRHARDRLAQVHELGVDERSAPRLPRRDGGRHHRRRLEAGRPADRGRTRPSSGTKQRQRLLRALVMRRRRR